MTTGLRNIALKHQKDDIVFTVVSCIAWILIYELNPGNERLTNYNRASAYIT